MAAPMPPSWSTARQKEIADLFARGRRLDVTKTVEPSPVDALVSRDSTLVGVAEIKSRDLTAAQLVALGSYLVTFDKLVAGRAIARCLHVPFLLIVGLYPAREVLYWKVADADGYWTVEMDMRRTTTAKTCDGGHATRCNAYLALGAACDLSGRQWLSARERSRTGAAVTHG